MRRVTLFFYQNDKYYEADEMEIFFTEEFKTQSFFSICVNIRGLNIMKNFIQLESLINCLPQKPHVIFINETFLQQNEEGFFNNIEGYNFISNSRKEFWCGDIAYIKSELIFN